ncbi:hypothetical protein HHK36_021163 [Tetracentron sinense]|uniref:SCP domain-containing protein n=1 Tax=Tetracentron sinense TaxID=13715 RepID=A0A835D737_TETSI|nr:hypothetical protein HHK36_021163 [Tetracentron sinense]
MASRGFLSCGLLGTFLLISFSLPSFTSSDSSLEVSFAIRSRRVLNTTPGNIVQQYLVPHNLLRAKLGIPALQWSEQLANYANWWANQRKGDCALIHSDTNYGENIFWGSGSNWKPRDAVAAWAAEKQYYNYPKNSCLPNRDCLHYTQIIWRQSLRVGCAKVTCKSGDTFISCNYDPHGLHLSQSPQQGQSSIPYDTQWMPDSGATNHMTFDPSLLDQLAEYPGSDQVVIGNGKGLQITHIGNSSLCTSNTKLKLDDVLVVPGITRNLLSVARLTKDNHCSLEFFPWGYVNKDLRTRTQILKGLIRGNLYPIAAHKSDHVVAYFGTKAPTMIIPLTVICLPAQLHQLCNYSFHLP